MAIRMLLALQPYMSTSLGTRDAFLPSERARARKEDTCHNPASFPKRTHIKLVNLHLLDKKHRTPHEVACATPAQNSE